MQFIFHCFYTNDSSSHSRIPSRISSFVQSSHLLRCYWSMTILQSYLVSQDFGTLKNTGQIFCRQFVHLGLSGVFLVIRLQGLCMCAKSVELCAALCDPMDCPGSSVHGILQARILGWVAMLSSMGSSLSRDQTMLLMSPALAGGFSTTSTTWDTPMGLRMKCILKVTCFFLPIVSET